MPSLAIGYYPDKYGNSHSGTPRKGKLGDRLCQGLWGPALPNVIGQITLGELFRIPHAVNLVAVCLLEKQDLLPLEP